MFKRIRGLFTKSSKAGYAIYQRTKQAEWMTRNYGAFADEGYKKNVVAFQAINKKARAVAQIPWVIKDKSGKEVVAGPVFDVLNQPNPLQTLQEWLEATVAYREISGNAYWERTTGVGNRILELYSHRPDCMKIKIGQDGFPAKFVYKSSQSKSEVEWVAEDNEIRHIKTFNPLDEVYGMSPIEAAAYSIDQHNESNSWLQSLLQNGAAPSGALVSDKDLSDDAFARLKAEMDEKYSGASNAGRPLLLEGGLDWKQMGLSPQNMSILENKYSSARDIALAFEVPPLLLNIKGDNTYANYKEARLAFYEETIIPLAQALVSEFNQWNEDQLNGSKVELDLDQIPAIIEKRQQFWEMANNSTELTINERRAMKGYEPIEGGDVLYIDTNKIPITFDQQESEESERDESVEKSKEAYGK